MINKTHNGIALLFNSQNGIYVNFIRDSQRVR